MKHRPHVLKNISLLYFLQGANYLVPLVTVPYLSRVLGVSHFGVMGIALGVVGFMIMLTDWGFSWTATQEVARNSERPEILHRVFWDTFWARIGLGIVAFVVMGTLMLVVPSIRQLGVVLMAASVQVISSMFGVYWFLQGLERMGSYVTASMAGRVLAIPLTFLLVHKPEDVALAALIPGVCGLTSSFVSFRVANRFVRLLPMRFQADGIFHQLRIGAKIFFSTGAISLYTQSNVLILSLFAGKTEVGLFHGSDRIRGAVQTLTGPVGTALFPRINKLMDHDRRAAHNMMFRMLIGQGGLTLVLSILMYVLAPWGVPFALGHEFAAAVPVVQWLSPTPFLIGVSNVLGINVMLPLGMKNAFATIVASSAVVNFTAMVFLCPRYGAIGAAASTIIAESFVTVVMAITLYLERRNRRIRAAARAKGIY